MKKGILNKLTIVDYIIILGVICAIAFAFIHITTDDSNDTKTSSYDSSTMNKIVENYLKLYREGNIIETSVSGYNATTGEKVELHGNISWIDDDKGSNVKVLINSNGTQYLAGLYKDIPYADIYIDSISLESDGNKYKNLTEVTINPKNITSLNELISGIKNSTNYEITTTLSVDELSTLDYQELSNSLYSHDKRISIKGSNTGLYNQLIITRATSEELNLANGILGTFDGSTSPITIRIYNCTGEDLQTIENNYNVTNIKTF
ncbi:adhesin [uncultured Methanobrevibacter sp.]|uniref:adhesin n=1 Tax=uncultured Methanobrevibacter sp. TaxID=253161 RepID=UPI0026312B27|nr:adhesin [uncultured Methanobrevibacter sp.]